MRRRVRIVRFVRRWSLVIFIFIFIFIVIFVFCEFFICWSLPELQYKPALSGLHRND
ncbi:hypothetical protein AEAC466_10850 [Asticcacaulis sp. AC466]|nr:hypothetical protein AEAC466_10850 [Asticcacaulis sp. AC466]